VKKIIENYRLNNTSQNSIRNNYLSNYKSW